MKNYRLRAVALAFALLAPAANLAGAQLDPDPYCSNLLAPGIDRSPNRAHTGRYINPVYGYAVTIPMGLTAYTSIAGPERGFWVVLSWTPRVYLRVDAAYDAFYDITAEGVHRRDVIGVRLYGMLLGDQAAAYGLAHTRGGRYLMQVRCAGSQVYVHDDVIVMRNREIYRLDLQSVPDRYASDVKLLDAMLHTWQWVSIRP